MEDCILEIIFLCVSTFVSHSFTIKCVQLFIKKKMQSIEMLNGRTQLFVFDLEFIGDVRQLTSCRIWELAVFCISSNKWFEKVIDPDPKAQTFPKPPIDEIPRLKRSFLTENNAILWPQAFQELAEWVTTQLRPGAIPVFMSHNTFRADKPILELECRRYNIRLPLHWYFFDSLHFSRSVIRNSTGNYSLSGLHEQLFDKPIENAHRARADVVACMNIVSKLTHNTWSVSGPMYPSYSTSLRSIRWVGRKAEEILCSSGITSVESFLYIIENNVRRDYLQFSITEQGSIRKTISSLLVNKLPVDNINNIITVIDSMRAISPMSHTFMLT